MNILSINFKLLVLLFLVLLFFASNSLFARAAIKTEDIDFLSYTFLRVFFAMLVLLIIYFYKNKNLKISLKSGFLSGFMFFLYAICFSYSYINMEAGLGTLILFAVVQLSMILIAIFYGEKLSFNKFFGVLIAFLGLSYILYPKQTFDLSYFHTFLMFLSAIGWAIFSVIGKKSKSAINNATSSFVFATIYTLVFAIFYLLFVDFELILTFYTSFLAFLSGAITTAFGVFLWYFVLPKIEIMVASVVQLIVPVIAIFLSIVFLDEKLSFELVFATTVILLGIYLALYKKA